MSTHTPEISRGALPLRLIVLLPLTALLGLSIRDAANWRAEDAASTSMYSAFAADRFGLIPYRDLRDAESPGAQVVRRAAGVLLGYSDGAIRNADLLLLAATMAAAAAALRRLGGVAAWAGAVLAGLFYLRLGPGVMMRAETLSLPLVLLGLACATGYAGLSLPLRAALAGACFGAASAIFPLAVMGLLPVALYLIAGLPREGLAVGAWLGGVAGVGLAAAAGLLLPLAAMAGWLAYQGVWWEFVAAGVERPLSAAYSDLERAFAGGPEPELARLVLGMGGNSLWFLAGGIGVVTALGNAGLGASKKRIVLVLAGLGLVYALYPNVPGGHLTYEYTLLQMMLMLCLGLAFLPFPREQSRVARAVPLVLAALVSAELILPGGAPERMPHHDDAGRQAADELAVYLKKHLEAGETVQPVKRPAGAFGAMLYAEARPATAYLCGPDESEGAPHDAARREFIAAFASAAPRFVIAPHGEERENDRDAAEGAFPEFERVLRREYRRVFAKGGAAVWERRQVVHEIEEQAPAEEAPQEAGVVPIDDAQRVNAGPAASPVAPVPDTEPAGEAPAEERSLPPVNLEVLPSGGDNVQGEAERPGDL